MITRLILFVFWLIHFFPPALLSITGKVLGFTLRNLALERKRVVQKNLSACFPDLPKEAIDRLVSKHFCSLGCALANTSIAWWGSRKKLSELAEIEGWENFENADENSPVIVLAPHFVAVEILGIRISMEKDAVVIYSHQKNKVFDEFLRKKRARFSQPKLFSRQDSMKGVIRTLKAHVPLFLLPDMDFGPQDSIFVPFFGVNCATTTAPPRIANIAKATVVPVVIKKKEGEFGYKVTFLPAWKRFPSNDIRSDVERINKFVEEQVESSLDEYYWVHKRFKTRPDGEPPFY